MQLPALAGGKDWWDVAAVSINLVELDLATLEQLGGGAAFQQIRRLLEEAVEDMDRRPADKGARSVKINLVMTPITRLEPIDEQTNRTVLDGVALQIQMDLSKPKRKTLNYDLGLGVGGKLVFNPDSPFNHRQTVFPQVLDGEARPTVPMHAG